MFIIFIMFRVYLFRGFVFWRGLRSVIFFFFRRGVDSGMEGKVGLFRLLICFLFFDVYIYFFFVFRGREEL